MGAAETIWNAMEVAEEAPDGNIPSSSLTVDTHLPLPDMKPHIMFVPLSLSHMQNFFDFRAITSWYLF